MIRAIEFLDPEEMRRMKMPGAYFVHERKMKGLFEFRYLCPCGCGTENSLLIGDGHKPGGERPSWNWNGSRSEPTLKPSVHQVGHWHGHLTDGYWKSV